jgi:hypothetical protein
VKTVETARKLLKRKEEGEDEWIDRGKGEE